MQIQGQEKGLLNMGKILQQGDVDQKQSFEEGFLQGLKNKSLSPSMLLKLRLPKSLHSLVDFSPAEVYRIFHSPVSRMEGEEYADYKARRSLKKKILSNLDLLRQLEMIPRDHDEFLLQVEKEKEEDEMQKEGLEQVKNEAEIENLGEALAEAETKE